MVQSAPDRLAELAASLGEPPSGGDEPFRLADEEVAWFVERGGIDVFLVEYRDGAVVSGFKHVLRAGPGRLVFGVGEAEGRETLAAVARALPGTVLRRVRPLALLQHGAGNDVSDQVDAWIAAFSAAVACDVELCPHPEASRTCRLRRWPRARRAALPRCPRPAGRSGRARRTARAARSPRRGGGGWRARPADWLRRRATAAG